MPRNLFIAVILSTCLQLTALARTPRVVSLQKLPQAGELQQFYSSLHKLLGKQSLRNKAKKYGINLKPLQEFLNGTKLPDKIHDESNVFRKEYAAILGDKVDIADLLKYSELQALAEGASSSDTQANDYIGLVDSAIKDLPVKAKLYLFTIKLTLAGGTEVTLIKPGMSVPRNIKSRVTTQINSLNKIAFDPSGVTFNIRDQSLDIVKSLKVVKMEVKQVNLVDGRQKYLDLNYGVADTDVHRQLVANDYQMVHGIPNIDGGERKEVFSKVNKNGEYEDSNHADDVVTALAAVHKKNYLERQAKINGLNDSGISLSLPTKQQVEFIFADIQFDANSFKIKRARLAKMLFEIKWYEHKTSDKDVAQELRSKFDDKFNNYTDDEVKVKIEHLSEEVFVLRRIITAIQKKGETPQVVGRRLGLGSGYGYTSHLRKGLGTEALVEMGITINNEYPEHEHQTLHALFGDLLDLRDEAKEIKEAVQLLQKGINKAGDWQALQSAMRTGGEISAARFLNNLALAATDGAAAKQIEATEKRMAEVVLLYRIISAIQKKGEWATTVASKLGLAWGYTYTSHLQEGQVFDLQVLQGKIKKIKETHNDAELHNNLNDSIKRLEKVYDPVQQFQLTFLNIIKPEKSSISEAAANRAMQLLQKGINKAGGWQALQLAMRTGDPNSAGHFLNNLALAAIDGVATKQIEETEDRIAKVVLLYRIISAIQKKGEKVAAVARKLGLAWGYSYVSHLQEGREFDLEALQGKVEAIKAKREENTELHKNLDDSIKLLEEVYDPVQQFQLTFLNIIKQEKPSISEADTEAVIQLLHEGIAAAGGWQALLSAMRTGDARAPAKFLNNLALAAIDGAAAKQIEATAERMAEVVLLYRIISTIQKKGDKSKAVASKLGLGGGYSYASHLQEGRVFDLEVLKESVEAIKQQEIKALKEQETDVSEEQRNEMKNKHENLNDSIERLNKVYNPLQQFRLTFLNIIKQKRKKQSMSETDTEAVIELLLKSIGGVEGWLALQSAMRTGDASAAAQFRNVLARAALKVETEKRDILEKRMAEVVLLYRIITTIQAVEKDKSKAVASKLGLGSGYTYTSHLQERQVFDLQVLQGKIKKIKETHNDAELHKSLDDSIERLQQLREPKQLELPFSP